MGIVISLRRPRDYHVLVMDGNVMWYLIEVYSITGGQVSGNLDGGSRGTACRRARAPRRKTWV